MLNIFYIIELMFSSVHIFCFFKYSPEISKYSQIIFLYPSCSIPNKGYMTSLKSLFAIEEVVQCSIKTYSSHEIRVASMITAHNHMMQISSFHCIFGHIIFIPHLSFVSLYWRNKNWTTLLTKINNVPVHFMSGCVGQKYCHGFLLDILLYIVIANQNYAWV